MKALLGTLLLISSNLSLGSGYQSLTIHELKTKITTIAEDNMERLDNLREVRQQLAPLVKQLARKADLTVAERIEGKIGSWQQLWTDDPDDTRSNNFFSRVDRSRTFQVVDEDGFFYNVSELNTALNFKLTAFLRGEYVKQDQGIGIKFTKLDIKLAGTKDITATTYRLERGEEKFFTATRFSKYPQGPVGARGYIDTVYVDDELRVDYGYNNADNELDLFILRRVEAL